jgi:putative transcriptional regulator
MIEGSGGLRKVRFGDVRRAKGKRGGLRVMIYCYWTGRPEFWLCTLYDKDEVTDPTPQQRILLKVKPAPKITARELAALRKQLNLSRGLFAGYLCTNVRTLENCEQGRANPNAQAALLIRLVQRYPDTVGRLAEI